ncbi:hypothetical protein V2G26_019682 [Clonostachys chloroleuca]
MEVAQIQCQRKEALEELPASQQHGWGGLLPYLQGNIQTHENSKALLPQSSLVLRIFPQIQPALPRLLTEILRAIDALGGLHTDGSIFPLLCSKCPSVSVLFYLRR